MFKFKFPWLKKKNVLKIRKKGYFIFNESNDGHNYSFEVHVETCFYDYAKKNSNIFGIHESN